VIKQRCCAQRGIRSWGGGSDQAKILLRGLEKRYDVMLPRPDWPMPTHPNERCDVPSFRTRRSSSGTYSWLVADRTGTLNVKPSPGEAGGTHKVAEGGHSFICNPNPIFEIKSL
jgi:hypothetical protein